MTLVSNLFLKTAFCVLIGTLPALAEELDGSNLRISDSVKVEIEINNEPISSTDGFDIRISVTCIEPDASLVLKAIELQFPASLRKLRPDIINSNVVLDLPDQKAAHYTAYGLRAEYDLEFTQQLRRWETIIPIPPAQSTEGLINRTLAAKRNHGIKAVGYFSHMVDIPGVYAVHSESVTVVTLPPAYSVHIGGVIGSCLLAAFAFFTAKGLSNANSESAKSIRFYLSMSSSGAITAVVFILIASRLEDVSLPMNVSINDFWGGVIVGLFSYKISTILNEKLFSNG